MSSEQRTNQQSNVYAIIMCGGHGNRLWPLSTLNRPKQFLRLVSDHSMLQDTVARISSFVPIDHTLVVSGARYKRLIAKQLPNLPRTNIVVESCARGTAPCIGLTAVKLAQVDTTAVMVVLPADHIIANEERFLEALESAIFAASSQSQVITLGITPNYPATGYGYIKAKTDSHNTNNKELTALDVEHFAEKPDEETAKRYLHQGNYYWNSGMFIWRVDVILEEIRKHMPDLHQGLQEIKRHLGLSSEQHVIESVYRKLNKETIDYGVMEQTNRVAVIPTGDIGWDDVGDWAALHEILEHDMNGNSIFGNHIGIDTRDTIIRSTSDRVVATMGASNLVIIDTGTTLLVMNKDRAQDIKKLLRKINRGDE